MKQTKQKVIKVGNSLAVTIPAQYAQDANLKAGDFLVMESSPGYGMMLLKKPEMGDKAQLTPEFKSWLDDFSTKYGPMLKKLAKTP